MHFDILRQSGRSVHAYFKIYFYMPNFASIGRIDLVFTTKSLQYILFVVKINIIYLKSKSPFTEFMRNITEYVMKLWHVMKHSFAPNHDLEICPPLRRSQNCGWGRQTQPGKSVAINKEQRANSDPSLWSVIRRIFGTTARGQHSSFEFCLRIKLNICEQFYWLWTSNKDSSS